MAQFKSYTALVNEINKRVSVAIKIVAEEVCKKLRECINEQYYHDPSFYPNIYQRTEQFLNSTAYEMLGKSTARVGIDTSTMHYKNGFSATQVVEYAKQSMHGSSLYQTDTEDFWSVFIEWGDKNIPILLRSELRKQGLNVR